MLWEGKSLGQTQSTLMGRKRLIATNSGRPHCLRMAGPQDSSGSKAGRAGRWEWGGGLCCFLHYSADPVNPYRCVTLQKEQLSSPKQQTQKTAGSIPKAFWEREFVCPFPEAEEEDAHYLLGNTGSTGVPKALDPIGGVLKILAEWDFIVEFVDSIMEEDEVISEFFAVCQGYREFYKRIQGSFF